MAFALGGSLNVNKVKKIAQNIQIFRGNVNASEISLIWGSHIAGSTP